MAEYLDILLLAGHVLLIVWLLVEILLRKEGTSDTRLAWITLIVLVPYIGAVVYMLCGGRWSGRRRQARQLTAHRRLPHHRREARELLANMQPTVPERFQPVFDIASAVGETDVLGGNALELFGHGDAFIERVMADINAAPGPIHLLPYIYLPDEVGVGGGRLECRPCLGRCAD